MATFGPDRTIPRARKVLPAGGWEALSEPHRALVLAGSWLMAESDGASTKDELEALEAMARILSIPKPAVPPERKAVLEAVSRERGPAFPRCFYAAVYLVGMSDGVLLPPEREFLDEAGRAAGLESRPCSELEHALCEVLFAELLATVFQDGVVSARERQILNATRKLLGLTEEEAGRVEREFRASS